MTAHQRKDRTGVTVGFFLFFHLMGYVFSEIPGVDDAAVEGWSQEAVSPVTANKQALNVPLGWGNRVIG